MASEANGAGHALPDALELASYRAHNPDIASFGDEHLRAHYARHGMGEGRQSNALATRADFCALVPADADALEIGPFHNPVLRSPRTKYFDVLVKPELDVRARAIGVAMPNVPEIDFVSPVGDLSVVDQTFDAVISSHCLEHQPDLVRHLQQVQALLRPGGRYFLLVPDKRFCFDHFIAPSTVADVLDAHHRAARLHSLRNVVNHRAMTCHNDGPRHWAGDHGTYLTDHAQRVRGALEEHRTREGGYIDVHAWFFTPGSLAELLATLLDLGLIELAVERLYPTRKDAIEFWLVLRREGG